MCVFTCFRYLLAFGGMEENAVGVTWNQRGPKKKVRFVYILIIAAKVTV